MTMSGTSRGTSSQPGPWWRPTKIGNQTPTVVSHDMSHAHRRVVTVPWLGRQGVPCAPQSRAQRVHAGRSGWGMFCYSRPQAAPKAPPASTVVRGGPCPAVGCSVGLLTRPPPSRHPTQHHRPAHHFPAGRNRLPVPGMRDPLPRPAVVPRLQPAMPTPRPGRPMPPLRRIHHHQRPDRPTPPLTRHPRAYPSPLR